MTLEPKDRTVLSDVRMAKAREFLEDARANLRENRLLTAVNRSYYTALNASRALLILEGVDPESHDGVITLLSLRFVKPGLLSVEAIKKFKILLSRRTDVDYGDFETVATDEAEDSVKVASELMEEMDALRRRLIQGR